MHLLLAIVASYGIQRTPHSGATLWRDGRTIAMSIDAATVPAAAQPVIAAAFHAWEAPTAQECGGVLFQITAPSPSTGTVRIRTDVWPHSSGVASVTKLTFVDDSSDPDDGRIVRADVELNAVEFELLLPGATPTTTKPALDLQSVVTHEAGHVLGLDHDCGELGLPWPTDETGKRVPLCSAPDLPVEVTNATMYYRIDPNDTHARLPGANDIAGACTILARGNEPVVIGSCATSHPGSAVLLALAWLCCVRRRRS